MTGVSTSMARFTSQVGAGSKSQCLHGARDISRRISPVVERPIAFFSRVMNAAQRNYCPTRRELLAVIASLQHFRHYLVGATVILRTDHYSLKWLRTFKRPEGILARWIETLAEFDYTVEHRLGRLHSNTDGLSWPFCKQCYDRPTHIPWVDEMERADAAVGPWSVHLL